MFNKILKDIAYNPSAISQLSFYATRLKKEQSVRRLGLFFIIMTMFVQMFASLLPAQSSLAAAYDNDIVNNGFTTRADLLKKYDASPQLQGIYRKFGVERGNIAAGTETYKDLAATSSNYWSIGRNPLNAYGKNSEDWGEIKLNAGGTTVYQRPLKAWGAITERALQINVGGKQMWIIKSCGNLVTIGKYQAPASPAPERPALEVSKHIFDDSGSQPNNIVVKPGDTVQFRIAYRNANEESNAEDFRVRDLFDSTKLSIQRVIGNSGVILSDRIDGDPVLNLPNLPGDTTYRTMTIVTTVKDGVSGESCNVARVSADVVGVIESGPRDACINIVPPAPAPAPAPAPTPPAVTPPPSTPPPTTPPPVTPMCDIPGKTNFPKSDTANCKLDEPDGSCIASTNFAANTSKEFSVKTTASVVGTTKVSKYSYTLDDPSKGGQQKESVSTNTMDQQTFKDLKPGTHKVVVTVMFNNNGKSVSKTCMAEITILENAQITKSKSVTKAGKDINNGKVTAGDILEFRLNTKNITATNYPNYVGEDFFGDVLNYADIVDKNELTNQGIALGTDNYLRWNTASINGNSEEVKKITVKVKPIPSTNRPVSTSTQHDCVIANKYGNQVSMNVDCPLVKKVEVVNKSLPNTGPGTTLGLTFLITVFSGYFFARARLLAKESGIIRRIYQTTSGGL